MARVDARTLEPVGVILRQWHLCRWSMSRPMFLVLAFVVSGGCGESTPKAFVSGTVFHAGKPVAAGVVTIIDPAKGRPAGAAITDGKFSFDTPVDPGSFSATVTPERENIDPGPEGAPYWKDKEAADIPKKYRNMASSGLSFKLVGGKNELTIELD